MAIKHRPLHIHPDSSILFLSARIYGGFSYLASEKIKQYFLEKLKSIEEKHKVLTEGWVILDNHYHLLIHISKGNLVSKFIKQLHGSTSYFIKKNLPFLITEFGQKLAQEVTPWDKRQSNRLNKELTEVKRRLKSANTRETEKDVLKNVLANFSSRYESKFTKRTYRRINSAITKGKITDPQVLLCLISKDAPIWYQYTDRVIRNEKDYYRHLNYIHQNPVKHGYVKKISDYKWSSIHKWIEEKGKEWVIDCFRQFSIRDFMPEGIVD